MLLPTPPSGRFPSLRVCVFLIGLSTVFWGAGAGAQQQITPEMLRALQQLQGKGQVSQPLPQPSPLDQARRKRSPSGVRSTGRGQTQGSIPVIGPDGRVIFPGQEQHEPPSRLEDDYSARAGEDVQQFGYDIFKGEAAPEDIGTGRLPENYILGVGDELVLTFHGATKRTVITQVDREGRVIVPDLRPIPAAGRSFADFRREVEQRTKAALLGTEVFVSVGSVRQISIFVLGEVYKPGLHRMTSLATVLDALALAGGIKKSGTLRNIRIERGDKSRVFDLYKVLKGGLGNGLTLFDGDHIVVPVIGRTVAVKGQVKRPGIYELAPSGGRVRIADLIALAGGTLRPKGHAVTRTTFDDSGRQNIVNVTDVNGPAADGDIISVDLKEDIQVGSVEMIGYVRVPGQRSLSATPSVAKLIRDVNSLQINPYLPFAVLETTDPTTQARIFKPVDLENVLEGHEDMALKDKDRFIVLGAPDVEFLASAAVRQVILTGKLPNAPIAQRRTQAIAGEDNGADNGVDNFDNNDVQDLSPNSLPDQRTQLEQDRLLRRAGSGLRAGQARQDRRAGQARQDRRAGQARQDRRNGRSRGIGLNRRPPEVCIGLERLAKFVHDSQGNPFSTVVRSVIVEAEPEPIEELSCPVIYDEVPQLLTFVLEYVVGVHGAVRKPGVYPVTGTTNLASLVAVAGGLGNNVDPTYVELTEVHSAASAEEGGLERRILDLTVRKPASVQINPGSGVRFFGRISGQERSPVLLLGEFMRPGAYNIRRGEKLSEVIARAGGVTPQAYPYGTVFTRDSVRKAQEDGFRRTAREINQGLARAAVQPDVSGQALVVAQRIVKQLNEVQALGRMVVEADPAVLKVRPDLDSVLEPGDRIFVPKRPNFVSVIGDVLNPGTLQFFPGKRARDYLAEAGGILKTADDDRVFVVYPDGKAKPITLGLWTSRHTLIPPGSTIVIPKNVTPLNALQLTKDLAQIFSQLAVAAASITVINR